MIDYGRARTYGAGTGNLATPRHPAAPQAQLQALASAVGRLMPSHRDPERFHMDKAEIVAELRRLARAWV